MDDPENGTSKLPGTGLGRPPLRENMTLAEAFDLGYAWGVDLYMSPQVMEDSRAVGRTLLAPMFDGLGIDMNGWNSFQSGDLGMCEGKRRIKEALDRMTPARPSPGRKDPVTTPPAEAGGFSVELCGNPLA